MNIQISLNDYVTFYPTEEGLCKIKSELRKEFGSRNWTSEQVETLIQSAIKEDGSVKVQLHEFILNFESWFGKPYLHKELPLKHINLTIEHAG